MAEKNTEVMNKNFLTVLRYLNDTKNYELFTSQFVNKLTATLASNRGEFYEDPQAVKELYKESISKMLESKSDEFFNTIVKLYCSSPFGVFKYILDRDASDVFIVDRKISFTADNSQDAQEIIIPNELLTIYHKLVNLFIDMTLYCSDHDSTIFTRSNAVLDYAVEEMRFNVVHGALNATSDSPIIAIRKQLIKSASTVQKEYIDSLGLTPKQKEFVDYLGRNGSFIIFGETGSGKTTLMKYMGSQGLEHKRNLISIEDTPELFLPVNITYLTNENHSIHDLFKISLRENPSHVLVGETRNEEIIDILESGLVFNVGTTLHADSFPKVIMRILFMSKKAQTSYSSDDIYNLVSATIDGFIYMKNRKVIEVWKRKEDASYLNGDALDDYELVQ